MTHLLLRFLASPLFEVFAIWLVGSLITVAFRPGSELEAWTKQKGPRYFAALQMLRRAATDLPELADWAATFLWKRTPAEAQAELGTRLRVVTVSRPPRAPEAEVVLTPPAPLPTPHLPHPAPLPRTETP